MDTETEMKEVAKELREAEGLASSSEKPKAPKEVILVRALSRLLTKCRCRLDAACTLDVRLPGFALHTLSAMGLVRQDGIILRSIGKV